MGMTRRTLRRALGAALLTALVAVGTDNRADTLTKKDGKQIDGRIVEETSTHITMESDSGGITLRVRVAKTQIRSIERRVVEGTGYCVIPLSGTIGDQVTAAALQAALDTARRAGAEYVILQIDSPGGSVGEMYDIVRAIGEARDLKFVAHVKRAASAAAIVTLACPHIVMDPSATIGAAVIYKVGKDGLPKNIAEKFQSFHRAQERVVAEMGGHSDLWARGWSEMDLELYLAHDGANGRARPAEGPAPEGAKVLKKKGEIMTLTAGEALEAGLSEATVRDLDEIRDLLGVKSWHNAGDGAGSLMASRTKAKGEEMAAREDRTRQLKGDVADLDAKIQRAADEVKAAERGAAQLKSQYADEIAQLNAEYKRDFDAAMQRGGIAPLRAQEAGQAKASACKQRYEGLINEKIAAENAAITRGRDLIMQRNKLITTATAGE